MSTYQCPKCFNILPLSNKILHDLKCTKESPVEFSQENPYTSRLSNTFDYNNNDMRYSSNDYSNLRISSNFDLASEIRNTAGPMYHKRMSYMNDDGTTTEIKKDTNMAGKEELLEITYDPQGNIIGRKKADGGSSNVKFKFHELQEYSTYDPMDNYNIYEGGNVYVQTVPTTEIVYQPIESYTINYSNIPYEHDFGSRGYSLMDSNISSGNNVKMVDLNENSNNYTDNNYNYNNNNQSYNTNENLDQYFTNNNTNSYINNNDYTSYNNNINNNNQSYNTNENLDQYFTNNNTNSYINNNDYTSYNNNINYNTNEYSNYYQNTSTNNNYNNTLNDTNNYNYQSFQNNGNKPFQCAKVTKLN